MTFTRHDAETNTSFVICVDSTEPGPAAGGARATQYADFAAAVADATRLAGSMTLKMALANLPMGGGKSVIALPYPRKDVDPATWNRILGIHADNVNELNGTYWTGPDVNTNSADMDVIGQRTDFVFGRSAAHGGAGSSAPTTAAGVLAAMTSAARHRGLGSLDGLHVIVQGIGAVGGSLAALVEQAGAVVSVADHDDARLLRARELGYTVIDPADAMTTDCDIFAPCAMGGVITSTVAKRIPCAAIVGAANNALGDDNAGSVLRDRAVLFVPDVVASAGGAIHSVGRELLGWNDMQVAKHTDGIGDTVVEVMDIANNNAIATDTAARILARRRADTAGRPSLR
ncbi:Glu/Leu/Phe/Val dehydrogenase dimerization domain-containing protein [Rhodococcoides fascians]|uniref:Glu/Leu/Phe/Val dehydrogenase dimerization domain-containing protein n=1 Tax=Rhodococcoides fascians TaxID=1828 RepID=UPI000AF27CE3|nr:Glu/Leu/Phe/Val dehydrogenase dimerization domain-containing protein [Rhodococcus fascians]